MLFNQNILLFTPQDFMEVGDDKKIVMTPSSKKALSQYLKNDVTALSFLPDFLGTHNQRAFEFYEAVATAAAETDHAAKFDEIKNVNLKVGFSDQFDRPQTETSFNKFIGFCVNRDKPLNLNVTFDDVAYSALHSPRHSPAPDNEAALKKSREHLTEYCDFCSTSFVENAKASSVVQIKSLHNFIPELPIETVVLNCPKLEAIEIRSTEIPDQLPGNLRFNCPNLREFHLPGADIPRSTSSSSVFSNTPGVNPTGHLKNLFILKEDLEASHPDLQIVLHERHTDKASTSFKLNFTQIQQIPDNQHAGPLPSVASSPDVSNFVTEHSAAQGKKNSCCALQ